jgi:creatinine amidohydrolase
MKSAQTVAAEMLRWDQVEAYLKDDDRALISIGALEQHGPHLAMGTDTITASCVALDAGRQCGVLVYPPLAYGWSDGHMAFPGSITLRPETIEHFIEDWVESLTVHGFRRFLIVNGHRRTNMPPLQIAASRLMRSGQRLVAVADLGYVALETSLKLASSELGGLGHADELETSHMLYLRPEAVDMSLAETRNRPSGKLLKQFMPSDPREEGRSRYFLPPYPSTFRDATGGTGLGGDARPSNAAKGEQLHQSMVEGVCDILKELKALKLPESNSVASRLGLRNQERRQ